MSPRFVLLTSLLALAAPAWAGSVPPEQEPGRHALDLRLEPAEASFRVSDRYSAPYSGKMRFSLREGVELEALRCGEQDLLGRLRPDRKAKEPGRWEVRVPRSCAGEDGRVTLDFEFRGRLEDEPTREPSPHFVTGEGSTGSISEHGAFLSSGAGFYPNFGDLALHALRVDVPEGWAVASQGRPVEPDSPPAEGRARFAFEPDLPTDGLALSAGPYTVSERLHGETLLRTFLFEDDAARAELLLDEMAGDLESLEEKLGPYPHSKFALVESVFATGSGFPGYALLRDGIGAAGSREQLARPVGHALAHAWWGSGVHENAEDGAWCEGLATSVADAMAARSLDDGEAAAQRRRLAQRHALEAQGDGEPAANAVGDAKTSAVFHQLRRELGDDLFWSSLRELASSGLGRRISWTELRESFESGAGRELDDFFSQWIERPGLPRLSLAAVEEKSGRFTGALLQDGEPYRLRPELRVTLRDGRTVSARIETSDAETPFEIDVPGPVAVVELDPDWHLPRAVPPAELPHGLARTLAAGRLGHELIIAYPSAPYEATPALLARAAAYKALAEEAAERHGGEALPALAVADAEWNGASLLLLGGPDENPLADLIVGDLLEAGFDVTGEGFRAGSRRWTGEDDALLVSLPHPERAGASVSLWMPEGDNSLERGRSLFELGWDSWVALRGGEPAERGTLWPEEHSGRRVLASPSAPSTTIGRLKETVALLTRPDLEGRDAGTLPSRRTAEEVAAEMKAAGLEPWDPRGFSQVFFWFLRDLPAQAKLYRQKADRTAQAWDCTPAAYWLPVPQRLMAVGGNVELSDDPVREPILIPIPEGVVYAGTLERPAFRGLDLRGAAAVLIDDSPLPGRDRPEARRDYEKRRTAQYMELLNEVRRQEGDTLLIVRPQDEPPYFPALASFASLDHARDPELAAAAALGGTRGVRRAVSRSHAAAPIPQAQVRLAFAGPELIDAMKAEGPLEPGQRWWQGLYLDLRMRIDTERIFDRNIVGLTLGQHSLSSGMIVVGAHHDGHGLGRDGAILPGAVDNAAGTALLLELARRFGADPPPLTVAFVSFGASEWGLVGSRSLSDAWPDHWPVRALVNIDSVGAPGATVRVTGESREPALAATLFSEVEKQGLERGPEQDRRSDENGSDHWPWAETKVAAVTVTAADAGALAGPVAGLESIDFEALARLADALEGALRSLAAGPKS